MSNPAGGNVRTRAWHGSELVRSDFPLADISELRAEDGQLVWADVCRPTDDQMAQLADELDLHAQSIEDAVTVTERPKALRYRSHLFVGTFALVSGGKYGSTLSRVSAFVLPHALVTVRLDDAFDIDEVVRRWDENTDLLTSGPMALLYSLLDVVVDGYFGAVERLDEAVETLGDQLFDGDDRGTPNLYRRTFEARRANTALRRVIVPMREVGNTALRRVLEVEHDTQLVPYYEDLTDHILRAAEWTDALRDTISSIHDTNLSMSDNRMNQIMKKLTGWAAIIAVPTAITGYFGQNVPYPGFSQVWGFWLSTASIVLIAGALYLTFRRNDWL